jgi:hypothetical protein
MRQLKLSTYFCLIGAVFISSCATYQSKVETARKDLAAHDAAKAVATLKPLAEEDGKDQLVYLLDYAIALQLSGNYKESAKILGKAEKIADIQDYTSLSREASSLILNAEMVQYKGDDYEKILINAVNAINYLMMNQLDDALVEVRRVNEKLYKFKYEAKKNYEQSPYASYLSAMIWEADGRFDDSYIDYKKAYELVPNYEPLHTDLIRAAIRAHRDEDVQKWKKEFPDVQIGTEFKDPKAGELILIYQQGWGPRKYPRPGAPRFPKLFPVAVNARKAELEIMGIDKIQTTSIYSVQDVGIKTLENDYAGIVAKRLAGVATKAVLSDQIRQKNQLLGDLAFIALNVADRADLRQWSTLPETFQIARKRLKPGTYKISVKGLNQSGGPTGENMPDQEVNILPGRKTFITWRSFH